ncbi:MAG TPA: NAD(P)/FAD-dependent oxidoreductase [Salinimicrobium sp.]|nr:NAD(P)/FAD-dependent oxidoreductase [Salinimicrobium sp.]
MFDFVVVGAAQAGLAMAYHLKKMGKEFLIVDKESEIGASWLNRWDSLKLFTPTEFNHLEGLDFPAPKGYYPNKYEVADYFKKYVEKFQFDVKLNTLIEHIQKENEVFTLKYARGELKSRNVVIATGPFHLPYTPACSKKLNPEIFQIHSNYYKNPKQLQEGATMVVGAGDSGFQILDEVSDTHRNVYFSGETNVAVLPQKILGKTLWWWFSKTGFLSFSKNSWIGNKINHAKQPIIGTDVKGILKKENVIPVGRVKDAEALEIITEKKICRDVKNMIWATGYHPDFTWIEGLELDKDGYPKHQRGISNVRGLYFIGLPWLHTRGSATLGGVKKDAVYLAGEIE